VRRPSKLPAVDERLIAPETRYEIIDGRVLYVPPADEPHGTCHSKLSALLECHKAEGYSTASDMLTRTSETGDMAPDASVYPSARNPETGGRQLEELAFEIASTQAISEVATKAARLSERGVRRVFALDLKKSRALEWSAETGRWKPLPRGTAIEDRCLAAPLPVDALLDSTSSDDANARALLAKGNPVLEAAHRDIRSEADLEARAEILFMLLAGKKLRVSPAQATKIRAASRDDLDRWIARAATVATTAKLLSL